MLYDTHAHLNLAAFDQDRDQIAAEAIAQHLIFNNVGTSKETSKRAVKLADGQNTFATVGLHPGATIFADSDDSSEMEKEFDYEFYKTLAQNPKVVGIGECGLDYYRIPEGMNIGEARTVQQAAFIEQIKLAKELDKTLVVHLRPTKDTRDAYHDALEILIEEQPKRFVIHSYTSDWHLCEQFLKIGAHIALNGIITFDKTGVLKEVIEKIPLEKLVLETDAPYLAPAPHRGKRNLPQYVEYTARYIADIRGISYEEIAETTTTNAKKLFKIE